jgi:hypothetical protein
MDVNWKREIGKEDLKPAVKRYRRYLKDKGLSYNPHVCIACEQVPRVLRDRFT